MTVFSEEAELRTQTAPKQIANWELLAKVRGEVLKALETARNEKKINSGLEAKVLLNAELELKAKLKQYLPQLPGLFIVSQVDFLNAGTGDYRSDAIPGLEVTVQKAEGRKCERCWNYSIHVGENKRCPTICERCTEALAEIEQNQDSGAGAAGVTVQ
jgi:isoleucyl-tRNA synthetase